MALNTAAKMRDEGNWQEDAWSPLIASSAEFDTYVGDMLDRANNYLRARVGTSWYTTNSATDPYDDMLKEAEAHLCQATILEAAAGIAECGDDTAPAPFLGTAEQILKVAARRRELAEDIILWTRQYGSSAKPAYFGRRGG
jgi:hypothetical protein